MNFREYIEIYDQLWQDTTEWNSLLQTEMRRLYFRIQAIEKSLKEMKIKKNEYDTKYYNYTSGALEDELKHYKIYFTALSEFYYGYPTTNDEYYNNMIQVITRQKKYIPSISIYLTDPVSSNITDEDLSELKEKLREIADEQIKEIIKGKESQ